MTFAVSLRKAEQAFVKSSWSRHNTVQPIQGTAGQFSQIGGERTDAAVLCFVKDLLPIWNWLNSLKTKGGKKNIICKEQTTAGWEWEEIQDIIFCKIRPGVESDAVAAVFSLCKAQALLLAASEVQVLTEDKEGQWGKNNKRRWEHSGAQQVFLHCEKKKIDRLIDAYF